MSSWFHNCSFFLSYFLSYSKFVGHSRGVQISPEHRITDLEYAGDVVLFTNSYDEMQTMLNNLSTKCSENRTQNVIKTKVF